MYAKKMSFGGVLKIMPVCFSNIFFPIKIIFGWGTIFNLKIWEDIYVHLHKCIVITLHVMASMNTISRFLPFRNLISNSCSPFFFPSPCPVLA